MLFLPLFFSFLFSSMEDLSKYAMKTLAFNTLQSVMKEEEFGLQKLVILPTLPTRSLMSLGDSDDAFDVLSSFSDGRSSMGESYTSFSRSNHSAALPSLGEYSARKRLHDDAVKFSTIASSMVHNVHTIDALLNMDCCSLKCQRDLSWSDIATVRGNIVQSIGRRVSRDELRSAIVVFLSNRVCSFGPGDDNGYVVINRDICGRTVCCALFIRILGIGLTYYWAILGCIAHGIPVLSGTAGNFFMNENVIRSIARIAVEVSTIGQFNPGDTNVMLPYGVGKKWVKCIDFLTCEICKMLSTKLDTLNKLTSILRADVMSLAPIVSNKMVPNALEEYRKTSRKRILMKISDSVLKRAKVLANTRNVDWRTISPNDVVQDFEVLDKPYVDAINASLKNSVSVETVRLQEDIAIIDLETHLASMVSKRVGGEGIMKWTESDTKELASRISKIDTVAERITGLKRFHHSHVVHERLIVECANEMAGVRPNEVLALQFDGCGKDKTKLPSYTVNDKSFRPAEAMMMPVVSWQMAVPSNDECGISKFSYKNYDYVLPFTWTEVISTDVMVSTLLNVLTVQLATPIPPIIAIVMDNGSSGKSVGTIRVLAMVLEKLTQVREIHLYFPTVGHTHGSVDQHFGVIADRMKRQNVLTVQELCRVIEGSDRNTRTITNFNLYSVCDVLNSQTFCVPFKNIVEQHHFLLYRDSDCEIRFSHEAFLRFAEPLSARVQFHLQAARSLLPLSEAEKKEGVPVFLPLATGFSARNVLLDGVFPRVASIEAVRGEVQKLRRMVTKGYTVEVENELNNTVNLIPTEKNASYESMRTVLENLDARRTPNDSSSICKDGLGRTAEETLIAQELRIAGVTVRSNPLKVDVDTLVSSSRANIMEELLLMMRTKVPDLDKLFVEMVEEYGSSIPPSSRNWFKKYAKRLKEKMDRNERMRAQLPVASYAISNAISRSIKDIGLSVRQQAVQFAMNPVTKFVDARTDSFVFDGMPVHGTLVPPAVARASASSKLKRRTDSKSGAVSSVLGGRVTKKVRGSTQLSGRSIDYDEDDDDSGEEGDDDDGDDHGGDDGPSSSKSFKAGSVRKGNKSCLSAYGKAGVATAPRGVMSPLRVSNVGNNSSKYKYPPKASQKKIVSQKKSVIQQKRVQIGSGQLMDGAEGKAKISFSNPRSAPRQDFSMSQNSPMSILKPCTQDAEAHSPVLSPVFTRTRSASRGVTQKSSIVVRRNKAAVDVRSDAGEVLSDNECDISGSKSDYSGNMLVDDADSSYDFAVPTNENEEEYDEGDENMDGSPGNDKEGEEDENVDGSPGNDKEVKDKKEEEEIKYLTGSSQISSEL